MTIVSSSYETFKVNLTSDYIIIVGHFMADSITLLQGDASLSKSFRLLLRDAILVDLIILACSLLSTLCILFAFVALNYCLHNKLYNKIAQNF